MKIFIIICMIFPFCWSLKRYCPFAEDIQPCICNSEYQRPSITCESLASSDGLRKAVPAMKGHSFTSFTLAKSNIGALPADIFSGMDIRILNINYADLTSLSENINRPPFLGLENSLEYLEIKDSFINESVPLTRLSLSHLKKIYSVRLDGNIVPAIGNDWFESGPYHLRELYLLDTRTDTLGSHAFVYLKNLRKFSLTGSHLSKITREMFPLPAPILESLTFSNNRMKSLPDNFFSKMPSLHEVFLENNDFATISEMVFAPIWSQINSAYFYGNPLNCDGNMKWMYKYRLPQTLQGYCVFPDKLRNKALSLVTLSDLE